MPLNQQRYWDHGHRDEPQQAAAPADAQRAVQRRPGERKKRRDNAAQHRKGREGTRRVLRAKRVNQVRLAGLPDAGEPDAERIQAQQRHDPVGPAVG